MMIPKYSQGSKLHFSAPRMLTPSEIESLRLDSQQALEWGEKMLADMGLEKLKMMLTANSRHDRQSESEQYDRQ